jgi:hypothetical protein
MEQEVRATATSLESFEVAARKALRQSPEGPEGLRSATIEEQTIMEGGFVGRPQYGVTVVVSPRRAADPG